MQARALLDNRLLWQCFDELEKRYIEGWKASLIRDVDGREQAYAAINVIAKVREHLERMVADGDVARATIEQITRTPAAHRK